jgi:hypothetical protein
MKSFVSPLLALVFLISIPFLTSAAGLVPACGGIGEDPCQVCHFVFMIDTVMQWLVMILSIIISIIFVYAGIRMVTSVGDAQVKTVAKKLIINAATGFVIVLSAWIVIDFILQSLVGNTFSPAAPWHTVGCATQPRTNGAKVTAAKHNLTTFTAPEVTTAATTINSTPVNQSIVNAAAKAGMTDPTDLNTFLALMYVESDSCTQTVSTEADVYGCGQISVATARSMDPTLTSKTDEEVIDLLQTDTDLNLYLSAKYFDHLTKLTGSTDDALALYNAGPVAMQPSSICADTAQWQCAEDKAYQETTNYVANVKAIAASTTLKPPVLPPQNCTVVVSPSIHTLNVSESRTLTMDCAIGDGLSYVWTNNGVSLGQTSKSISFSGTELGTYYLSAKAISEAGETEAGMMLSVVPEYVAPGGGGGTCARVSERDVIVVETGVPDEAYGRTEFPNDKPNTAYAFKFKTGRGTDLMSGSVTATKMTQGTGKHVMITRCPGDTEPVSPKCYKYSVESTHFNFYVNAEGQLSADKWCLLDPDTEYYAKVFHSLPNSGALLCGTPDTANCNFSMTLNAAQGNGESTGGATSGQSLLQTTQSKDPGIGSGLWVPTGYPNLFVVDQSGTGITTSYVPGCINGTEPGSSSWSGCAANTSFTTKGVTVEVKKDKVLSVRYKSNSTAGTSKKWFTLSGFDGGNTGPVYVWLTDDPLKTYAQTDNKCKAYSTSAPSIITGPMNCQISADKVYYLNIQSELTIANKLKIFEDASDMLP